MEILWNKMCLQGPPYRSWDISVEKYDPRKFIEVIDSTLNDFKYLTILNKEAALLSRVIYRMKSKFRNDKGFKYMEKVNRALLNYLNVSLEKEYKLLKKYIEICNGIVSLPSRQNIEYILVRTQGFAKLMCHIESTAIAAGNVLKSRLHIGQSWSVAMIAYAIIGRIWVLSRYLVRKLCVWYSNIYKYINIFKIVGISWLPDNYFLPKNLSKWLDVPWLNEKIEILPMKGNNQKSIFNLIEVNENNKLETCLSDGNSIFNENSKNEIIRSNIVKKELIVKNDDDIGKPIDRTNFENNYCKLSKKIIHEKNKKKNNLNRKKIKSKIRNNKKQCR